MREEDERYSCRCSQREHGWIPGRAPLWDGDVLDMHVAGKTCLRGSTSLETRPLGLTYSLSQMSPESPHLGLLTLHSA